MKLYIAGPMRGIPELNFPTFHRTARQLRAAGHEVFNPAENADHPLRAALALDLAWICEEAEGVIVLPGHQLSRGARAEKAAAMALDIPVWTLEAFLSLPGVD